MGLGALQPGHLIVVLVIVLLIFGPGKLPELGKSLGDGIRELKKATTGEDETTRASAPASTVPAAASTVASPTSTATATAANAAMATARVCPSCNNSVTGTDKFCGHCGAALAPTARAI